MYKTTGEGKKKKNANQHTEEQRNFFIAARFCLQSRRRKLRNVRWKTSRNNPHERHACMHEMAGSLEAGFWEGRRANRHPLPPAPRQTRCQPAVPVQQLQATACHSFLPARPELCMGTASASAVRITENLTPIKQVCTRSSPVSYHLHY